MYVTLVLLIFIVRGWFCLLGSSEARLFKRIGVGWLWCAVRNCTRLNSGVGWPLHGKAYMSRTQRVPAFYQTTADGQYDECHKA